MSGLIFIFQLGLTPTAHAVADFGHLMEVAFTPEADLDFYVDSLTIEFTDNLRDHDKDGRLKRLIEVPGGYHICYMLILDITRLPQEVAAKIVSQLRRIYVEGEPWKGKTYRFIWGNIGFTPDREDTIHRIQAASKGMGHKLEFRDFEGVCDYWLGVVN